MVNEPPKRDERIDKGPLVIADACRACGSAGTVKSGGDYRRGEYIGGDERPCARCAARTALAFLLVRIGSWTSVRWDRHVRDEYGDEVADELAVVLREARIPVDELARFRVSDRGVHKREEVG